jgi:hypothetical protein
MDEPHRDVGSDASAAGDVEGSFDVATVNALDASRLRDIREALIALWTEVLIAEYRALLN